MITLYHHPFCPHSRFVRLALAEFGLDPELIEERPWERRREFLLLSPEGATPVLVDAETPAASGANLIAEYLDETQGAALGEHRLMPEDVLGRLETRRLMNWFNHKFFDEVSNWLVGEKIYKRFRSASQGGGGPDMEAVRAARTNLRYHLRYIGHLIRGRNWLAGERLTFADLAAAAHLSCADFLGDVPWVEDETAKDWYARDQVAACTAFFCTPSSADTLPARPAEPRLRRSGRLAALRVKAGDLGFDLCRIASPISSPQTGARLDEWIAAGRHGDMEWMETTRERRSDPRALWSTTSRA